MIQVVLSCWLGKQEWIAKGGGRLEGDNKPWRSTLDEEVGGDEAR